LGAVPRWGSVERPGQTLHPYLNVAGILNLTCKFPFFRRMLTAMLAKTDHTVKEVLRADFSQT
jgi:hypothetical protein